MLLDLDENSKQQQQKAASREVSSPSSAVNQQDQGLLPGSWRLSMLITYHFNGSRLLCIDVVS